jgi:hypothetical protein
MTFLSIVIPVLLTVMLAFAFNNFGHGGKVYSALPVKVSILSEVPIPRWNKTYGGINQDRPLALVQTPDKGYVIACSTYSYGAGSADIWLIKTDVYGNMEWNKTYGGMYRERAWALVQTSDKGYTMAGSTAAYQIESADVWLIKLAIPEFSSATILLVLMALIALTAAFMEKSASRKAKPKSSS